MSGVSGVDFVLMEISVEIFIQDNSLYDIIDHSEENTTMHCTGGIGPKRVEYPNSPCILLNLQY